MFKLGMCREIANFRALKQQLMRIAICSDHAGVEYKAKLVSCKDILANDCNLSVSSYVEKEDKREAIDIKTVNATLSELIAEGNSLNAKIDSIIKEIGE